MKKFISIFMLAGMIAHAQSPQTQTAPIIPENAKYVNGVAPGYYPTAGSGLTLNVGPGTANCAGTIITYAGGTLTLTASTTNYIYLNTASSCAPATKTTAFTSSDIPLAKVITGSASITSITDDRTPFFESGSGGSGLPTTGGTMTGPIAFSGSAPQTESNLLMNPVSDSYFDWCSDSSHCTPSPLLIVNVSDFTTCNGSTDNTAGIQAANDASAGAILNFPLHGADCIISSTITNAGGVWNLNGTNLDYSPCTGTAIEEGVDFTLVIEYGGLQLTCVSGTPTMIDVPAATLRMFEALTSGPVGSIAIADDQGSNVWIDDVDFGNNIVASQSEIEARGINSDVDTSQIKLDSMVAVNLRDIRTAEFTGASGDGYIELSNTLSTAPINYVFSGSYIGGGGVGIHAGNYAIKINIGVTGSIWGAFDWTKDGGSDLDILSTSLSGMNLTSTETSTNKTINYVFPLPAMYQTCDASKVPLYSSAVCTFTLSSAQILAYDGTTATTVPVIGAPGSGKVIVITASNSAVEYVFNSAAYSADISLESSWGVTAGTMFGSTIATSQTASQVSISELSDGGDSQASTIVSNSALSVYCSNNCPVTSGNGTIILNLPYTVYPIQ